MSGRRWRRHRIDDRAFEPADVLWTANLAAATSLRNQDVAFHYGPAERVVAVRDRCTIEYSGCLILSEDCQTAACSNVGSVHPRIEEGGGDNRRVEIVPVMTNAAWVVSILGPPPGHSNRRRCIDIASDGEMALKTLIEVPVRD